MMRRRTKPMQLVVDCLPAHKTVLVKECVGSIDGMLTLHYRPGYARKLNPNEFVGSHMKRTGVARCRSDAGATLQDKIEAQIAAIKRTPQLDRSSFSEPLVK